MLRTKGGVQTQLPFMLVWLWHDGGAVGLLFCGTCGAWAVELGIVALMRLLVWAVLDWGCCSDCGGVVTLVGGLCFTGFGGTGMAPGGGSVVDAFFVQ